MFSQIPQFGIIPFFEIRFEVFIFPFWGKDQRCVGCCCLVGEVKAVFWTSGTGVVEVLPEVVEGFYYQYPRLRANGKL
jgi:hypothetical protein